MNLDELTSHIHQAVFTDKVSQEHFSIHMFFPIHEFFKRSKIQIISWHFQVNFLFLYNLETVTFS
jgi:hypothetical protein